MQKYGVLSINKSKNSQQSLWTNLLWTPVLVIVIQHVLEVVQAQLLSFCIIEGESVNVCKVCTTLKEILTDKDRVVKQLRKEEDLYCTMNEDLKEQLQAKELLIQDLNSEREKNFVAEKDVEELKLKCKELKKDNMLVATV